VTFYRRFTRKYSVNQGGWSGPAEPGLAAGTRAPRGPTALLAEDWTRQARVCSFTGVVVHPAARVPEEKECQMV